MRLSEAHFGSVPVRGLFAQIPGVSTLRASKTKAFGIRGPEAKIYGPQVAQGHRDKTKKLWAWDCTKTHRASRSGARSLEKSENKSEITSTITELYIVKVFFYCKYSERILPKVLLLSHGSANYNGNPAMLTSRS